MKNLIFWGGLDSMGDSPNSGNGFSSTPNAAGVRGEGAGHCVCVGGAGAGQFQ